MGKRLFLLAAVALALAIGIYVFVVGRSGAPGGNTPPSAAAPPPAEVGVMEVRPAEVPLPLVYAGRVASLRDVEVRPRVSGLLLKREYEEGQRVTEGQVLFRIDPATYEVALARAEAQLRQAEATLRQAEENFARNEELFRRGVANERQRDEAVSARDQGRAGVQLAQAEVQAAKLNLSYTVVTTPAAGVTALQSPSVGTLIQAQQTLLTTITQLDPAYVSFSFTDEEGQAYRALNERRETPIRQQDLTVELHYAQGSTYPHTGRIDTAAQRVDPQTGTIQARAVFPNPDGVLLPGQFVRVRVKGVTLPNAIIVPHQAVSQGPQGPTVYVLGEKDTAQVRPIQLGPELADGWVVEQGLKGGERVIADGVIRVRPGAPVRPVPFAPDRQTKQAAETPGGGNR